MLKVAFTFIQVPIERLWFLSNWYYSHYDAYLQNVWHSKYDSF